LLKTGQLIERKDRFSNLPGAKETRDGAVWTTNPSTGKEERFFYPRNIEECNHDLNAYALFSNVNNKTIDEK
jgi:hypothetical protein